jgi:hypothetical protein
MVVDRLASGLNQENVSAADGFFQRNGSFAVSEGLDCSLAHGQPQLVAHSLGKITIGVTAEDLDVFVSTHRNIPHSFSIFLTMALSWIYILIINPNLKKSNTKAKEIRQKNNWKR